MIAPEVPAVETMESLVQFPKPVNGGLPKIRVAQAIYDVLAQPCVLETPPCERCLKDTTGRCGGIYYQFLHHYFRPIFGFEPVYVEAHGYSPYDGPDSVINLLATDRADISEPGLYFLPERAQLVPAEFPLTESQYVALIRQPNSEKVALLSHWSMDTFLILAGLVISYFVVKVVYKKAVDVSYTPISDWFARAMWVWYWLVIAAVFAYLGSAVTLVFNLPPKPEIPFNNFAELAEGMHAGRFYVKTQYNATMQSLFYGGTTAGLIGRFNEAAKVNPPGLLSLSDGIKWVMSSPHNVYLIVDTIDQITVEEKHCADVLQIHAGTELPPVMAGFYYSRSFHKRMNWYQRHILHQNWFESIKKYMDASNETQQCDDPSLIAGGPVAAEPIEFVQLQVVFKLTLVGFGLGGFAVICELIFKLVTNSPRLMAALPKKPTCAGIACCTGPCTAAACCAANDVEYSDNDSEYYDDYRAPGLFI